MYLKRLEIKGFKSFADSTEICLRPGINIIVGPNGCGKSNIVDAIRWVIGETNIRHLRGQKSEDVIFNGTDSKKALGMAYVEITVDNSDRILPVDYSEVNLVRKIFRSGESEFYLNKSKVRLKDITQLFMGTGLGKKGYSIISQGELEQVLNGSSLDRRLILEEASGIIKYRQQRDDTTKRIQATGNDLIRLNDIIVELEKRQIEVRNKALKAQQYLKIAGELGELEKKVLLAEITRQEKDLLNKTSLLESKRDELNKQIGELKLQEVRLKNEEENLQNNHKRVNELVNTRHEYETQIASMNSEIRLCEERVKGNLERIKTAESDEKKYTDMLKKLEQELKHNITDFEEQESRYTDLLNSFEKVNVSVKELEHTIESCQVSFEDKKGGVFKQIKYESEIKDVILKKDEQLKKAEEKKERLSIHIEAIREEYSQQIKQCREIEKLNQVTEQEIIKNEALLTQLNDQKTALLTSLKTFEDKNKDLNDKYIQIKTKLSSIQDMQKNMVGYSHGVKSILGMARKGRLHGIMGLMGEIIDVPSGMELAIDIAVGKALENVVTQTVEQARHAIEYLKSGRLGRVTFLPLDILKVQTTPRDVIQKVGQIDGVLGIGAKLINYDQRFTKAVEYLLGRVLVVEDMEKGIQVFKLIKYPFRIVTLDGELINVSGALTGGQKVSYQSSPLQRRGEEKKLCEMQHKYEIAIDKNSKETENLHAELTKIEENITQCREKLMESRFAYDMQAKQIETIRNEVTNRQKDRDENLQQILRLNAEIEELELDIAELNRQQREMQKDNEVLNEELNGLKEKIDAQKHEYALQNERRHSYKEQLDIKKRELDSIKKNATQFEQVRNSYQQSQQDAQKLNSRLQNEINVQNSRVQAINNIITTKGDELKITKSDIIALQEKQRLHKENIERISEELIPIRGSISGLENNIRNMEIAIARTETELEGFKAKWWEKFNSDVPQVEGELIIGAKLRDKKKTIAILQGQIEEIGSVDINSINEYEEITERFNFISKQYEDLIQAKNSLEVLLGETEKLMYKDFTHFFLLASESFKKTFREMFGGGEACLKLESGENRLETGVDFEVKMPGKKAQLLNLLSGGERALTCIAFIFSLLQLKPAPFCLLDEIDAALDETNLIRLSKFLSAMSGNIQYIVITHRQTTIETGDHIYGITMPEKGVSSVLTINLAEAENMAG